MPSPITSLQNPRVLAARKLLRRTRRQTSFLVEGPIAVLEALRSEAQVEEIFLGEEAAAASDVASAAGDVPVWTVGEGVLRSLTSTTTPQGVVAVVDRPLMDLTSLPASIDLALVLAGVRDPGNAGTLVRSAVAAGVDVVIFTADSVDPLGPKSVRSTSGMLFHVPYVDEPDMAAVKQALTERGVRLVGAEASAERAHYDADLRSPAALVVGNEAWGFSPEVRSHLDETVSIPMPGPAESLNVAIAGSLLLFEAVRQRSATGR
jgi:TrmH family RNA methyltransferase